MIVLDQHFTGKARMEGLIKNKAGGESLKSKSGFVVVLKWTLLLKPQILNILGIDVLKLRLM